MRNYLLILLGLVHCFLVCAQTTTQLQLSSFSRDVPLLGYNLNSLTKPSWNNLTFVTNSKTLGVEILRYPGGTVSQYFDWQTGKVVPNELWQNGALFNFEYLSSVAAVPHQMDDLAQGLKLLDSKPIFVLNMLSKNLQSQLDMLHNANQLGIPIEYIELGNELYFEKQDFVNQYATPADYANDVKNNWIPALRSAFPDAQIIITGGYNGEVNLNNQSNPDRIKRWNDALLKANIQADGITYHYYFPPNTTTLSDPETDEVLAAPFKHWPVLKSNTIESTPHLPVYITEYNMNDGNAQNFAIATSWSHALYTATCFSLMLESTAIKMLLNHQITGNPSYASLSSYTLYGDTIENSITPEGAAMGLLHNLAIGKNEATKLQFSHNPMINPGGNASGVSYPSLLGWYFSNEQIHEGYVLNLSNQSFELDLNDVFTQEVQYQQITQNNPAKKGQKMEDLSISKSISFGKIILPPHSLTSFSDNITITNLNNHSCQPTLKIYPNPVKRYLNISFTDDLICYSVRSSTGTNLVRINNPKIGDRIDLSDLVPGTYILTAFFRDGNQQNIRFVKLP